jgi:hypothetical protein
MSIAATRAARIAAFVGVPLALVASGVVVSTASYSAFTASTSNPTNNWTAGNVALADDDANTAMFTATGLKPGSTGTKCIVVTSTGSLASSVKLYGSAPATTKDLAGSLDLKVEQGTGGTFSDCTGFVAQGTGGQLYSGTVAAFGSSYSTFANGIPTWSPTGTASESKVFRFTYTLPANAPTTVQGGTAALGFTWEAQNS